MQKSKRQPKNFFRYFVDEFILFRWEFHYEVNTSPEILAKALQSFDVKINSFWIENGQIIRDIQFQKDRWLFEFAIEGIGSRGEDWQFAKARGMFYAANGASYIEGSAILAGGGHMMMLPMIFGLSFAVWFTTREIVSSYQLIFNIFLLISTILAIAIVWWMTYSNRNYLLKFIENAIESAHEHTDKSKTS